MIARAGFLAAVSAAALTPPALAQSQTIRVAATANDTYAQAYYALDMGFFKQAGLDVALQTFTAGGPVTSAVAGGAADIGIAGPPTIAAGRMHGVPFLYVAGGGVYSASHAATGIVVAERAPIHSGKDFNGKTLAVGAIKDGNWLAACAWIDEHGGDSSTVRFVELPFATMGPAIKRGTIDGGTIPEPSQTHALASGGLRVAAHHFDAYGRETMIGGWFAREEWLKANPTLARRYAEVMVRTAKWANRNPAASAPILAKYSKIDDETMRTMIRSRYAEGLNPGLFQRQLDLSYQYKVIEQQISAVSLIDTALG